MKRLLLAGLPLLVLVGLYMFQQGDQSSPATPTPDASTSAGAAQDVDLAALLEQPPAPSDARAASVFRLADGDSFEITWDNGDADEIRLSGINAPEGDACFGPEARAVLKDLTDEKQLLIETIERDEFGRTIGNVWVDGTFVNATLVERGAALALSDGGLHSDLIADSQEQAKARSAGLWDQAACGVDSSTQIFIAWIESDAPGQDHLNKNGEWITIANDGEVAVDLSGWSIRDESTRHRYHFPDGFLLATGNDVSVFSGCGDNSATDLYWCNDDPVWNNQGDTAFLVDPDGRFVDTRSYG